MQRRRPGFTLIEVILVMVILAIVASFALPPAARTYRIVRINLAADQLRADLARARSEAVLRNQPVALTRNSTTTYTITGMATRTLPEGITFESDSSAGVTFTTYGTVTAASAQTFDLRVRTLNRAITVNPAGFVLLQ
jgi:prepilin-type N-terminal cleavage/methylation domain-containing protein